MINIVGKFINLELINLKIFNYLGVSDLIQKKSFIDFIINNLYV